MVSIKVVFGDSQNMSELPNNSVHLVVTSPPYFNAPYDFPDWYISYDDYLKLLRNVGKEIMRVLKPGRYVCIVAMDVRIDGKLYPIVADLIHMYVYELGFEYQERIIWRKPDAYIRISRRSGVLIQHPYPLYYYPDHIYEEIVVFRKPGEVDRSAVQSNTREKSKINIDRFQREKWYLDVWDIHNVVPQVKWQKYTAVFPEEITERLITLYSYAGETVLDPFLGTGTTCVAARKLDRNCIGYEIDLDLKDVIVERIKPVLNTLSGKAELNIIERSDAKHIRSRVDEKTRRMIEERLEPMRKFSTR
jgi:site-specific DNA-methyltransferase (adenine-specific)/site-specific DNA-methyltransferase (cytosine-N4-specific)